MGKLECEVGGQGEREDPGGLWGRRIKGKHDQDTLHGILKQLTKYYAIDF